MSGQMAEFCITSDLQALRSQIITTNAEEVKAWAERVTQAHEHVVVTEDSISNAKKNRAAFRKVQANIKEVFRMGKEAAMETVKPLEKTCNELNAVFERAVANYDEQIKAFDEAKKAEKSERLRAFFNQSIGEMNDFLTFENIFNPRWLNATYTEEQARKDIICEIAKCSNAVDSLRALHSEFETTLLDEFRRTHDLASCLKRNEHLMRLKEIEETRKRMRREQEQDAANKLTAARTTEAPTPKIAEPPRTEEPREIARPEQTEETPQMFELVFRVRGTAEQLNGLKQYMKENGIQFGRAD